MEEKHLSAYKSRSRSTAFVKEAFHIANGGPHDTRGGCTAISNAFRCTLLSTTFVITPPTDLGSTRSNEQFIFNLAIRILSHT
jgi:hypothetical protein